MVYVPEDNIETVYDPADWLRPALDTPVAWLVMTIFASRTGERSSLSYTNPCIAPLTLFCPHALRPRAGIRIAHRRSAPNFLPPRNNSVTSASGNDLGRHGREDRETVGPVQGKGGHRLVGRQPHVSRRNLPAGQLREVLCQELGPAPLRRDRIRLGEQHVSVPVEELYRNPAVAVVGIQNAQSRKVGRI